MTRGTDGHAPSLTRRSSSSEVEPELDREKRVAAEAALDLVADGMTVGLGTGSTIAYLLAPLAARELKIRCVATSPATARAAARVGLEVVDFSGPEAPAHLDVAIDGADQVSPSGWVVKGGGGAHTREKLVAAAASRFVVIVSENKLVEALTPPIPLELAQFGLTDTLLRLEHAQLRDWPLSPDGGVIADYLAEFEHPEELAGMLAATPGVVEHGLFSASMIAEVLVARAGSVERLTF